MPEQDKEPRRLFNVRLRESSIERIKERAAREDRNMSDLARSLLAYGLQHMPKDWGKKKEAK